MAKQTMPGSAYGTCTRSVFPSTVKTDIRSDWFTLHVLSNFQSFYFTLFHLLPNCFPSCLSHSFYFHIHPSLKHQGGTSPCVRCVCVVWISFAFTATSRLSCSRHWRDGPLSYTERERERGDERGGERERERDEMSEREREREMMERERERRKRERERERERGEMRERERGERGRERERERRREERRNKWERNQQEEERGREKQKGNERAIALHECICVCFHISLRVRGNVQGGILKHVTTQDKETT